MDQECMNHFTKEVITNTVRLRLLSNGIVYYTYLQNCEVNAAAHLLNHKALLELIAPNKKNPVLVDSSEFINVTADARKLIRSLETIVPISKRAVVVKSAGQRILSNFYIRVHKPIVDTKIFDTYESAIEWLLL
jgi:hypothetical protein